MQNSGKTITTHASLLPQGFPIFLHFNHVWVQRDDAVRRAPCLKKKLSGASFFTSTPRRYSRGA